MGNFKLKLLANLARIIFIALSYVVKYKGINEPEVPQFILALWHANQCSLYGVKNHEKLNVLISRSNDGEIVATATEALGIKTVRGSRGRGGAQATLQLIERLESGENIAITVDGPKGPAKVVKKGIIEIAKLSQVPIIPITWFSDSKFFVTFNSWDKLRFPICGLKSVCLYGEPIYVPSDCDSEGIEYYRKKLEDAMLVLDKELEDNYDEYLAKK